MKKLQILAVSTALTILAMPPNIAKASEQTNIPSFVNQIWEQSPAMQEAKAMVSASKANQKAASKWQYNPEIEIGYEDIDGEDKSKNIGISQTIDWSGKYRASGNIAKFETLAVIAEYKAMRQNLAVDVLSALAEFKSSKDIYNLSVKRTDLMERFSTLAQKGFKAGDIDQSEYNLAQLALSEALITQAEAETAFNESKSKLDSLIGFNFEENMPLPDFPKDLPEIKEFDKSEDEIIMQLPSIQAIKNREEAAKVAIKHASKNRLPDPTIAFSTGKDTGSDMIGVSLSMPVNVFNSYGAEVEVAKQEAIAQAKAFKNAFYTAKTTLKTAKRTYQLSKRAWENWQKQGALALSKQTKTLDRKFKVGELSATDYLVQIEQALDTQIAAKELHSQAWQSWFSWLGASGNIEQWIQNSGE